MSRRILMALVFALTLCLGAPPAAAFEVRPIVSDIELPSDRGGVTLTIANPRTSVLPITFRVVERGVNEDGSEVQTPADAEFVIFPQQLTVEPGQSRAVRVQYVGASPQRSRSFTLYAEEPAVDLEPGVSGVRTRLVIGASVHVFDAGTRPDPVIAETQPVDGGMRVTLENRGTRYTYIDALLLRFGEVEYGGVNLGSIAGRTLLPPGGRRTFVVPNVSVTPTLVAP